VLFGSLALATGILAAASCTDEKVVFRDRAIFEDPLPAAQEMLGYSDAESGQTACGQCHVDAQTKWATTAHAGAWETLQESGSAQGFCEGCHTVSELGNAIASAAGYTATGEDRYHDVQCESCHGPGLDHASSPVDANVPLASMLAGTDLTNGCGECHQGTHHPFVEEWAQSAHGVANDHAANREACAGCHAGEDALRAWGVTDPYLEEEEFAPYEVFMPITCGVCHDPHGSEHEGQLRFAIDVPSEDLNLCMKCHHKRGGPDLSSPQRGPHSPQGPLLIGEAGWIPPNLELPAGGVIATHGSEANPRLCAGCHVNRFEVTDEATGAFAFQATGHLFLATPCLDDEGIPTTGDCEETDKYYGACTASGCHGSEQAARGILFTAQTRLNSLATQLNGLLAQVPASEFSTTDQIYTTAEGAKFNAGLVEFAGTAAHNPFLTEALLIASIQQVQQDYGVAAPPSLSLERQLLPGDTR
jgi:predicted CXXCH cytochrome family protein